MIFVAAFASGVACRADKMGRYSGANWIRPDSKKCKLRAVVGQMATLKADHNLVAESNLALAA